MLVDNVRISVMYNHDTDFLFPPRVLPSLKKLRGELWQDLVEQVMYQEPTSIARMGFVLLMVKLGNCTTCHADTFRALRGCTQCAGQTVRRFRGSDEEIVKLFKEACLEVERYLGKDRLI
jgi:hypothetical protein